MSRFLPGIDVLLRERMEMLDGVRVGLVAHPASVDAEGVHSAVRLHACCELSALFGPEHGYAGLAAAGLKVSDGLHEEWGIPVFSLYGETRKPSAEMMGTVDVLLFDLQSLGVRCYTYASTLRYLLEAGAEYGVKVVVTDRPVPMAGVVDGPPLEASCESFVGMVKTPFFFGMTMGELARCIVRDYALDVELDVIDFQGDPGWREGGRWIPPSPGIKSYATALAYPATVCCEALPSLDYGRCRDDVFQVMAAPWMDGAAAAADLNELRLAGVKFCPVSYTAKAGLHEGQRVEGIRFCVTDEAAWRPCAAMVYVLDYLQGRYGMEQVWGAEGTRPKFFDKLLGNARIRAQLESGIPAREIVAGF